MMSFVQTIEVETASPQALFDHLASWHAEQSGVAPGYRAARVLADTDRSGRYVIEVEFTSAEEKDTNNQRAETAAWASKLRTLINGEPRYRNFQSVYTTA